MPRVFISIGTNIDREHNVRSAVRALRAQFGRLQVSPVYDTEPVGFNGDPFYNLVCSFSTEQSLEGVITQLRRIENDHGRCVGRKRFMARTLDLDVLLYGDMIRHDEIDVPRSEIVQYAFVLRPLCDLAPSTSHPELGKSFAQLWLELKPAQPLKRVTGVLDANSE